jgi:hypothetical protein
MKKFEILSFYPRKDAVSEKTISPFKHSQLIGTTTGEKREPDFHFYFGLGQ